jgi:hypothetical protein
MSAENVEQPNWYAIQTRSRHEKVVRDQLDAKSIAHLLPLWRKRSVWKDSIKYKMPLEIWQLLEGREGLELELLELLEGREGLEGQQVEPPLERGSAVPISLYFDLDTFSSTDIADIIALLSELYADIGGDGLVIDDVTLLDFQPALLPTEV